MKVKKGVALIMSAAMAVGGIALLAACKNGDKFVEDTNVWYAVGADTKGTLGNDVVGNWKPAVIRENAKFKRDETKKDENVFTLTLDIYAGNIDKGYSFKFLYKTSADEQATDDELWARQIGIENVEGYEGEGESGVVKMDGKTIFTTAGGSNAHNMSLVKGEEGTYTFTLKTFPAEKDKQPVISVKKDKAIEVTHDMWIYGDVNGFGWGADSDLYPLAENIAGDVVTWTAQLEITEDDLARDATGALVEEGAEFAAIQLYNRKDKKTYVATSEEYATVELTDLDDADVYPAGSDKKFNLLPVGKYSIEFNQATGAITIAAGTHDMYFRGSVPGMSWSENVDDWHLTESADKSYWTGMVTVDGTTEFKLYNALTDKWYGKDGTDANFKLDAGTYFVKFTLEGETIEYALCSYYLVGTFLDAENNKIDFEIKQDVTPAMVADGDMFTCQLDVADVTAQFDWLTHPEWCDNVENIKMAVKVVYGCTLMNKDEQNAGGKTGNKYVTETGIHTFTFNPETKELTFVKAAE